MPLSPQQIEYVHQIKLQFGVDIRMGQNLSANAERYGRNSGVSRISPLQGEELSKRELNPVVEKMVELLSRG
jgi:hypothetical protein